MKILAAWMLLAPLGGCFTAEKKALPKEIVIISPKRARTAERLCKPNKGLDITKFTKSSFSCLNGAVFYR